MKLEEWIGRDGWDDWMGCEQAAHLHLGVSNEPQGAPLQEAEEIAGGDGEQIILVPLKPHPLQPVLVAGITDAIALRPELAHLQIAMGSVVCNLECSKGLQMKTAASARSTRIVLASMMLSCPEVNCSALQRTGSLQRLSCHYEREGQGCWRGLPPQGRYCFPGKDSSASTCGQLSRISSAALMMSSSSNQAHHWPRCSLHCMTAAGPHTGCIMAYPICYMVLLNHGLSRQSSAAGMIWQALCKFLKIPSAGPT